MSSSESPRGTSSYGEDIDEDADIGVEVLRARAVTRPGDVTGNRNRLCGPTIQRGELGAHRVRRRVRCEHGRGKCGDGEDRRGEHDESGMMGEAEELMGEW
jgi:hypothetical protein